MRVRVDPSSSEPIYAQIARQATVIDLDSMALCFIDQVQANHNPIGDL